MNFKRLISVALVGLFLLIPNLACTTYNVSVITKESDEDSKELYLRVALPTVMVRAETGTGSGVVFGNGLYVLTAAHVISRDEVEVDNDGNVTKKTVIEKAVIFKNESLIPFLSGSELVKVNHDLDLAILKLAKVYPYGSAKFAPEDPELYEKCWVSGHPHGVTDPMITEGRVQDLWAEGFILYSAPSTFGNSGGPVWLKKGKEYLVSSVVQRVYTEGQGVAVNHMGLGALPSHVREFVKEVSN